MSFSHDFSIGALLRNKKFSGFGRANFILDNTGSLLECYDVDTKKIGQGSYGSVSKAVNKSTKAVRAVKTISKSHVKNIDRFKQEIAIMKMLDHPNIIKLFETFEEQHNKACRPWSSSVDRHRNACSNQSR
mmetsp:Transcript_26980/g.22266  ORF Transcript_26980/g.22266 Transcript_26980/m.22266 type:complete len:131 (+) Transcript_26980:99-491(+)